MDEEQLKPEYTESDDFYTFSELEVQLTQITQTNIIVKGTLMTPNTYVYGCGYLKSSLMEDYLCSDYVEIKDNSFFITFEDLLPNTEYSVYLAVSDSITFETEAVSEKLTAITLKQRPVGTEEVSLRFSDTDLSDNPVTNKHFKAYFKPSTMANISYKLSLVLNGVIYKTLTYDSTHKFESITSDKSTVYNVFEFDASTFGLSFKYGDSIQIGIQILNEQTGTLDADNPTCSNAITLRERGYLSNRLYFKVGSTINRVSIFLNT